MRLQLSRMHVVSHASEFSVRLAADGVSMTLDDPTPFASCNTVVEILPTLRELSHQPGSPRRHTHRSKSGIFRSSPQILPKGAGRPEAIRMTVKYDMMPQQRTCID